MTIHPIPRTVSRGLSLIELLVSLAIGLIVIGVGASSYIDVVANSRSANVLGQMTEDANIALGIMRSQVVLAGYSRPIGVQPGGVGMIRAFKGGRTAAGDANNFIFGCDGGFFNGNAKNNELNITQLQCTAAPSATATSTLPDAIAVVYEADTDNTYPTGTPALPTDCVGESIPAQVDTDITGLRVASNKFYLSNNTLFCQGNGRASVTPGSDAVVANAQAIVENIYDLQILYGVAGTTTIAGVTTVDKGAAVAYLTASDLNRITGTEKWSRVVSVRICVEVRSASTVAGSFTGGSGDSVQYVDCQNNVVDAPANQLARTFSTTVVLHNRL